MKKILYFSVCTVLSLSLSACISIEDEVFFGRTVPKHGPKEMWINNGSEPQYIDPQKASGSPDGEVVRNMFGRLTEISPLNGKPIADLAERWEVSEDGKEFTFFMRKNLKWSDGKPLNAHDVEYSWKRLLDPETASKYASIGFDIVNGDAFHQGAVFIKADGLDVAKVEQTLKDLSIRSVNKSETPKGIIVFPKGDDTEAVRKTILKQVNDDKIFGTSGFAEVVDGKYVQAKALDDIRFQVKLYGPLPYFLSMIEFYSFAVVPRHVIEAVKEKHGRDNLWVRPENIVCSHAFCLEKDEFKQYKIFKKNPYYWDAEHVTFEKVKIFSIESGNTSIFTYRTGDIDWTGANTDIPLEYIKELRHYEDFHNDPYLGVYFYVFNTERKPLNDKRVRKALSLAVDREGLSNILGGGEVPYADLVMDDLAGYKALNSPLYQPEKAKQLLAEAGYPNGKGFPKIDIMFNTLEKHKQIAEAVQQMWKKTLNIDIELDNKEWKVYMDDFTARNYEISRLGWIGDFIDPYTFLELGLSTSGNNRSNWENLQYDNMIRGANQESDGEKRLEMLREAEKIISDEQPMMPLFIYTRTHIKKPYLKGFWFDYQGHHLWKYMWIDERYYDGKYHKETPEKEDVPRRAKMWPDYSAAKVIDTTKEESAAGTVNQEGEVD